MADTEIFRCSRCGCFKEGGRFGLNRKNERNKTCKRCNKDKIEMQREKKEFTYELNENWKEHPIYKGYYADKFGHVINNKTKRLIGRLNDCGYIRISFRVPELKHMQAHRFIYECWNEVISDEMVINHIDEIKNNNFLDNLELVTASENSKKSTKLNKINKEGHHKPKAVCGTCEALNKKKEYKSLRDAERKTGCNHCSIQRVCDGEYNTVTDKDGNKWIFKCSAQ